MKKLSVVVIGSGPSALATVRELLSSKIALDIKVVDAGNQEEPQNAVGLKSHFGSLHMYDQSQDNLRHVKIKPVTWPSASKGGFSRIWGAVINPDSFQDFPSFIEFNDKSKNQFTTKSAHTILETYSARKNKSWTLLEHRVAVDPTRCTMCGKCLTGCPENAIWFAGDEWTGINEVSFVDKFRVQKISTADGLLTAYSSTGGTVTAEVIFLAAGPIASSQILMRSNFISNSVSFDDSQAVFFPALRIAVRENQKSFALSQISAKSSFSGGESVYIQLYPDSRNLVESIKMHRASIGKLISKIWVFLSPWIATGICYVGPNSSPKLVLTKIESDKFELSSGLSEEHHHNNSLYQEVSRKILNDFRIFPLFFLGKVSQPGESYHFGSSKEILAFNASPIVENIRVVDASSLPHIEAGPITSLVMQNARRIVRETMEAYT